MAGVAGALYVPQVGIINPSEFAPGNSIEAVIWVAVGGRGTLTGAVLGAVLVNYAKTWFTSARSRRTGCSCSAACSSASRCSCRAASSARCGIGPALQRDRAAAAAEDGVAEPLARRHEDERDGSADRRASLPRRRHRLVRRLPGAEQPVARRRARRDARHHRAERRRQDHDDGRRHRQDPARRRRRRCSTARTT